MFRSFPTWNPPGAVLSRRKGRDPFVTGRAVSELDVFSRAAASHKARAVFAKLVDRTSVQSGQKGTYLAPNMGLCRKQHSQSGFASSMLIWNLGRKAQCCSYGSKAQAFLDQRKFRNPHFGSLIRYARTRLGHLGSSKERQPIEVTHLQNPEEHQAEMPERTIVGAGMVVVVLYGTFPTLIRIGPLTGVPSTIRVPIHTYIYIYVSLSLSLSLFLCFLHSENRNLGQVTCAPDVWP